MPFPQFPNFKLKSAEEKEPSPLPVFPLSLSFHLPNLFGSPSSSRTTKPCGYGSTITLLRDIFPPWIVISTSAIFTTRLLCWCVDWYEENNVISILKRNLTRFVTTMFLGGKGRPSKGIRDEVGWGNLPTEMWGEIGKRLAGRLDILRFRSVCENWRSSLPFPTRFPLQVPPPPNCDPEFYNMPYFITEVIIYSFIKGGVGSLGFEEVDQGGKFLAKYAVPRALKFKHSMVSFMESPKHPLSKLQFACKAYHLRMAIPRFDSHKERIEGQWDFQSNKFAKKMVLISSNADGVNPSYARASDLSVVVHLSWGSLEGRLALLRLGGSPKNWIWDTDFCTQVFLDIATYKGQLCTLDPSGRVCVMNLSSLQMTQIAPPSSLVHELRRKHLFEASGELYLADLYKRKFMDRMKIYKLCLRRQKWIKVDEIGNRILALVAFLIRFH